MALDLSQLEARYLNSCRKQGVLPSSSILSSFLKVKHQMMHREQCSLEIFIDQLVYSDFPSLIDAMSSSNLSEIDAVDVCQRSSNISLKGEYVISLLHAVNQKLRVVDLIDWSFWKDALRDICHKGLTCQILNLRFAPIRKLNMTGKFMELHTLNLDFSIHLTSFQVSCFSCMPKLMSLSMCATRVANLWTTSAALSKLPSLVELRFQNCLCCSDTGPCPISGEKIHSSQRHSYPNNEALFLNSENILLQHMQYCRTEETFSNLYSDDELIQSMIEESTDESDLDSSSNMQGAENWSEILHAAVSDFDGQTDSEMPEMNTTAFQLLEEVIYSSAGIEDDMPEMSTTGSSCFAREKLISHHPSPICFEKYYREYIIYSLPCLKVLDNLPVKNKEREKAKVTFRKHYEDIPYNRPYKESVVSILQKREMGNSPAFQKQPYSKEGSHSFARSLSAAKLCSSPWPQLHPVSKFRSHLREDVTAFRPRQFEYHPCNPSLMVFGTLDGELVVINHERQKLVGYLPSVGTPHSILGLCWLKKYPSKLIAGSDNGSLQLYDVCRMPSTVTDRYCSTDACMHTFDEFEQLTSVHINSTDEYFLVSGFSKHMALYDIGSGRRLQILKDLHQEHINVVKFSHHSPSIFATASFDQDVKMWDLRQGPSRPCFTASSSRGNVMVCFSPDDHYLLTSAIDNEVKQLLAVDGRLHTEFHIASIGSAQNYTRSYYMNGRDYIVTGSCEENIVRICCAQTGRRLRDLSLADSGSGCSMFVQSLRGDPFRMFHMSVLAAYLRPCTKSEIIKVNLLSSGDSIEDSCARHRRAPSGLGG